MLGSAHQKFRPFSLVPFAWICLVVRGHAAIVPTWNFMILTHFQRNANSGLIAPCYEPAMSSLDEIQSLINSAKDELAESRKLKEQVEHETVQAGETQP